MMLCLVQMRGVCDLITRTVRGPEGGRNLPADSVTHHSLSLFFALIVVLLLAVAGVVTLIISTIAGDLDHKFAKPLIRNSGNKDTNYMLAILDSRMKIVAHERFQYVLLKKFGESFKKL